MLEQCEVFIILLTLAEISPLCQKQMYQTTTCSSMFSSEKMVPNKSSLEPKVQVVDVFMNFEAPTITLEIGCHHIAQLQLDRGVAVNLITEPTVNELGLTNLEPKNIILPIANQSQMKPLGILYGIKTIVGGLQFLVSYLVLLPHSYGASFPI